MELLKQNQELRAALQAILDAGVFAGLSDDDIRDCFASSALVAGGEDLNAIATLKARALLSQSSPDVQFTDGIKAVDLVWDDQHNDASRSHSVFGVFWVRASTYREGYSAFFGSELIDLNKSPDSPMIKDKAKFICQVAFQAMVFKLIERKLP